MGLILTPNFKNSIILDADACKNTYFDDYKKGDLSNCYITDGGLPTPADKTEFKSLTDGNYSYNDYGTGCALKKDIVNNIISEAQLSHNDSVFVLEKFILLLKKRKEYNIKIRGFGRFFLHTAPNRIGRNPKTKKEYQIPPRTKLAFKASEKLKKTLN